MGKTKTKKVPGKTYKESCAWRGMDCGDCFPQNGNGTIPLCFEPDDGDQLDLVRKTLAKPNP